MLRRTFLFLCAMTSLAIAAGPALAVQYTITDLGTIAGSGSSQAYGINSAGQVTGYATAADGKNHAFLWTNGSGMTDLGLYTGTNNSTGYDVNSDGTVAGLSGEQAMIYPNGGPMEVLFDSDNNSAVNAINDDYVVGNARFVMSGTTLTQAFICDLDDTSSITNLATIGFLTGASATGNLSTACDINNNNNDIVGYASISSAYKPFLYDGTTMTDLSTIITGAQRAWAINDNEWITGDGASFSGKAFLYDGSNTYALGYLTGSFNATHPRAINNSGQVVGYTMMGQAFLYDKDNGIQDLYTLLDAAGDWTKLSGAYGINDSGQIVGYGTCAGNTHAFLLTPVPEPSTITLAALGLIGLLSYAWRKRK